jgi:hypothetical protein
MQKGSIRGLIFAISNNAVQLEICEVCDFTHMKKELA